MRLLTSLLVALAFSLSFGSPVIAQEGGNLADFWTVTINPGESEKFEAAFKKHMAVRIKKGDPRVWEIYTPAVGASLNHYVIRSCCVTWAELDSYDEWAAQAKVGDHWNKTIDKYVENYAHEIHTLDLNNSNWRDSAAAPALISLTSYLLKPGRAVQWSAAMSTMSKNAMEGKWPYNWSWGEVTGGAGARWLALPYDNYAGMAPPSDPTFAEFLAKQMGSKTAAMKVLSEFSNSIQSTDETIYRFRPDLSTATDD